MATTKRTAAKKVGKKTVATKTAAAKRAPAKKAPPKKTTARKASVKPSGLGALIESVTKKAKALLGSSPPSHAAKRTLIEPHPGDKRYVRRDPEGQFKHEVDAGRSISANMRSKTTTKAKPGQGDKGDTNR